MTTDYRQDIAKTILSQIEMGVKMSLGFHDPMLNGRTTEKGEKQTGVTFKVRVLPFRKDGTRGSAPRIMRLSVFVNALDYYDVEVGYLNKFDWVKHFETTDIPADSLNHLLLALDWNGAETTNPRYWTE